MATRAFCLASGEAENLGEIIINSNAKPTAARPQQLFLLLENVK